MVKEQDRYYYLALLVGFAFHSAVLFATFTQTYDAYVHMFFADHYANNWFGSWSYKWYTGFTVTSYPPLIHQLVAICSKVLGIKLAFLLVANCVVLLYLRGVYTFAKIWVSDSAAAFAALVAVFYPPFVEALHLFGQLPSITGVSFLLNACPYVYHWVRFNKFQYLFAGLSLLAATTSAHHVSTIFGMVFFVLPVMGTAVIDRAADQSQDGSVGMKNFMAAVIRVLPRAISFGVVVILIVLTVVFPYWYWSKSDPIAQVSIPHGSRDSFLEVLSSGLVFFLIPWSYLLLILPYIFRRAFQKRFIFLGLSLTLAFVLGTGGTTPIPRKLLGDTAFEILTLDRFTFWATMLSLPFVGEFFYRLLYGDLGSLISSRLSTSVHRFLSGCLIATALLTAVMIINLGYFRPLQPKEIDIKPIVNFLGKDMHDHWRYLTLGFGDQMAWLSANTSALTVDGNYHSVRRLPEFTTRAVERLENAKYLGSSGLSALRQFLTVPEKYHLKYVFNNDKFYEPLLHFSGWLRTGQLENGIVVWERPDVAPLPAILPSKHIPRYQSLMWGLLPLCSILLVIVIQLRYRFYPELRKSLNATPVRSINSAQDIKLLLHGVFALGMLTFLCCFFARMYWISKPHYSPENLVQSYFDALDFKFFEAAYQHFDPELRPDFEQYMLELSLEDGILASYAKLNNLHIDRLPKEKQDRLTLKVKADWMTALMSYTTTHYIDCAQREGDWFIVPQSAEKKTPPEQFFRVAELDFHKQGRRQAITGKTFREDELDRPDMYIPQASLIKCDSSFAIVGEIINTDTHPAYVGLQGILYDQDGIELLRYNTRDLIKHNLLPKESSLFRIDFSDIQKQTRKADQQQMVLDREPANFVLFAKGMVNTSAFYKHSGSHQFELDSTLNVLIYNYGSREISVPQVLSGLYQHERLCWVQGQYLPMGIRPQRSKQVKIPLDALKRLEVLAIGDDSNLFVNGSSRRLYESTYSHHETLGHYPISDSTSVQFAVNSFTNFAK